jgi:hypothetical protein
MLSAANDATAAAEGRAVRAEEELKQMIEAVGKHKFYDFIELSLNNYF